MKIITLLFILIFTQTFSNCKNKTDSELSGAEIQPVELVDEIEEVDLPPPSAIHSSKFASLQAWLMHICDTENPNKSIMTYHFGLYQSGDSYVIFLTGLNRYEKNQHTKVRIEFEPSDKYYTLPKNYYENLTREQLQHRLSFELKDFTTTDKFKNSFLAKATTITADFSDMIWSNIPGSR